MAAAIRWLTGIAELAQNPRLQAAVFEGLLCEDANKKGYEECLQTVTATLGISED